MTAEIQPGEGTAVLVKQRTQGYFNRLSKLNCMRGYSTRWSTM